MLKWFVLPDLQYILLVLTEYKLQPELYIFICLFLDGHGQSPGKRGQVYSYDAYVNDIIQHCEKVKQIFPNLPLFIVGHSMVVNTYIIF